MWTDALLDQARQQADAEADALLTELATEGYTPKDSIALFDSLIENRDTVPPNAPPIIQRYFDKSAELPSWANLDRIKHGERVFERHGPTFVLALFCKALPECYAGKKGVQVLYSTGRLNEYRYSDGKKYADMDSLQRRIVETAQFLLDVMQKGGISSPTGRGTRSSQKVRLIHASIRHFMLGQPSWHRWASDKRDKQPAVWDTAELGKPINQEDIAATMLAFSFVSLEGVRELGIHLSNQEQEDYYHAWRVVGHIMGLKDEYSPENLAEAQSLWAMIQRRQFEPSPEGKQLTRSLINFMVAKLPSELAAMPEGLMQDLMSEEVNGQTVASMLGVGNPLKPAKSFLHKLFAEIVGWIIALLEKIINALAGLFGIRRGLELLTYELMQALVLSWNDHKQVYFEIPPGLRENWGLQAPPPTPHKA
jgi:hypothetical protein